MQQILVYGDSLTWGIIPTTRERLPFEKRWPGAMEGRLLSAGLGVRVIEDCLNGRRTAWEDPFKPGRNGLEGLEQRIEINSPLALVIVFLGTNDFQSMHAHNTWHAAQGVGAIVRAIRRAPLEPGMALPEILIVAPPLIRSPRGPIARKFEGAENKAFGLGPAYEEVATELGCAFFDASTVTASSAIDGVHLDADQHLVLASALGERVAALLGRGGTSAPR